MMEKITTEHPDSKSLDILADNIEKLKEIFPEVVSENRVDFEKLQLLLNDAISPNEELYGLNWWGKNEAIREAMKPSLGTLRPCKEESVNWDTTENLHIEGDNLEVLKLLQKSYNGKVKMIYIDPPYNTGKDFVYKDNFKDNLKNYLAQTGQIDEEGEKQSTNTKDDGRYHSNWLNMMYPRLKLARNLMTEDGVIFISIDDNEVDNLRKICNEIFGENNFITTFVWRRRKTQANLAKHISPVHDFILAFSKNDKSLKLNKIPFTDEYIKKTFLNPDNDNRGLYQTGPLARPANSNNKEYELEMPNGRKITAKWSCSQQTFNDLIKEDRLVIPRDGDGMPRKKIFLSELEGMLPNTWLDNIASNDDAAKEITDLFGSNAYFSYPKPTKLIEFLINFGSNEGDLILDFFSGSATTPNAVLNLNKANNIRRKFLSVQLPEIIESENPAFKEGFNTISQLGSERIRRAGTKILTEKKEALKVLQDKMILTEEEQAEKEKLEQIVEKLDIGFKVFKLDSSNIEAWDTEMPTTNEEIQYKLEHSEENIKPDRKENDLLYEFLLKQGKLLTAPILEKKWNDDTIYNVNQGELFICLTDKITSEIVSSIGTWAKECLEGAEYIKPVLILKDNAFLGDDALKTNTELTLCSQFGFAKINTI